MRRNPKNSAAPKVPFCVFRIFRGLKIPSGHSCQLVSIRGQNSGRWYCNSGLLLDLPAFVEGFGRRLDLARGQERDAVLLQGLRQRVVLVGAGKLGKLRHDAPERDGFAHRLCGSRTVLCPLSFPLPICPSARLTLALVLFAPFRGHSHPLRKSSHCYPSVSPLLRPNVTGKMRVFPRKRPLVTGVTGVLGGKGIPRPTLSFIFVVRFLHSTVQWYNGSTLRYPHQTAPNRTKPQPTPFDRENRRVCR